ncbi:MAG TPA: TadE/TadG family type IV pilus assembly protein [Candidatus Limnocylindrales bacterium]|nr:TadE/TadG family type IV pilus assembly protein [Candidatus Limnocylindrales bacterium]
MGTGGPVSRSPMARLRARFRSGRGARGQSLAEFALVAPILLLVVVAIADFGRLYNSMVAIESAAREAADYGSFKSSHWTAVNAPTTVTEMRYRACTAAAGSHLEGYQGLPDNSDCTNPLMECSLEPDTGPASDCATYADPECSDSTNDPPCTVHVTMTFTFRPFFNFQLFGWSPLQITFERHSLFRISDLPTP